MMIQLLEGGTYLVNGTELVEPAKAAAQGLPAPEEAAKQTMAYNILRDHNTSGNMEKLQIKFDKLTSHDITFVGIIQTARASGLEKFPICREADNLLSSTTLCVLLEEPSTKMTICLALPVRKNTVVSMFRLIRQLFISLQERCLPAVAR